MADQVAVVPNANAVAGGGADANQQQQPFNYWGMLKGFFFRMMVIYFVSSLFRQFRPQMIHPTSNETGPISSGAPSKLGPARVAQNLFRKGTLFDLYVYLSEDEHRVRFNDSNAIFWRQQGLQYGDWKSGPHADGSYEHSGQIVATPHLQNNGSLYIHVYVVKADQSPDPTSPTYDIKYTVHQVRRLNKYKKRKYQRTQNLLTGKTDLTAEDLQKLDTGIVSEVLSHWHPNLTINIVDDHTAWQVGSLPSPLDEHIKFDALGDTYFPIVWFNDYWNLGNEYQPINDTVTQLNLTITYQPMGLFKWQMYVSQSMRNKWTQMLGGDLLEENENDQDSLKQAILETNPYILGITIVVSILHTVFEMLAFKNDIQFWRNRKSLEGLSVRSVIFSVATSVIVLLYIIDNDTNFIVRVSVGIGLLIELWKIPKCMDVSVDWERRWLGVIPRLIIADKGSYVESSTKEYDQMAFRYLSWLLYPLLGGYAVYSLLYQEHRGWYSWVLSMLYGFLLTFGFIMMTPQLFINYKLKSVAHLPWRMLTYKFLNTFIDDIFAFVIRMPTMYRIGCLRDDIVFLIYVYQRWIYRVDPSRLNEFGTSAQMHDEAAAAATGALVPNGSAHPEQAGALSESTSADEGQPANTDNAQVLKHRKKKKNQQKNVAATGSEEKKEQ